MYPFFHIFGSLVICMLWWTRHKDAKHGLYVLWGVNIFGALLPDLIDKPISLLMPDIYSGRGIFHAPAVSIFIILLLFWVGKNNEIPIAFSIGIVSHLILDLPNIPLLWPFVPIEIYHSNVAGWITNLFGNPLNLLTEIVGLVGIGGMAFHFIIRKGNGQGKRGPLTRNIIS